MDPKSPAKRNSNLRTPGLALSWVFSLLRRDSALVTGYGTRGLHPFGICLWSGAFGWPVPFGIPLGSGLGVFRSIWNLLVEWGLGVASSMGNALGEWPWSGQFHWDLLAEGGLGVVSSVWNPWGVEPWSGQFHLEYAWEVHW